MADAPKKVLTEDVYAEGSWAATFRKGDEVDDVHIEQWHLEDKVTGGNTAEAKNIQAEKQGEEPTLTAGQSRRAASGRKAAKEDEAAPKSTDNMIDPSPDSPQGGANDPTKN